MPRLLAIPMLTLTLATLLITGPTAAHEQPWPSTPRDYGWKATIDRGWGEHWDELDNLWQRESKWDPRATNRRSGACGIPQRYPCKGLSSRPVPEQVAWGLEYIESRYGDPSKAWAHFRRRGWY